MAFRASAAEKGLTLTTAIPETLPLVESDTSRIRQVLGNLLSNARKYTPEGGRNTVESEVGRGSTFTLWLPPRAVVEL